MQWNLFPASERARTKARQGKGRVRTIGLIQVDAVDPTSGKSVKKKCAVGEIVLKGGSVMLGYLKDPEETSKCMKNGWFYTGGVGMMHPYGYLGIKHRSKDVNDFNSGGEKVCSAEGKLVFYWNLAVNEAAVVTKADEFRRETPCAFVCLKSAGLDCSVPSENDIMEFCRKRLPHFMAPKTSTGKIQKFVLREIAMSMA